MPKPRYSARNSTTTAISERTGLSRDEIKRMREEAYRETIEGPSREQGLGTYKPGQQVTQPKKGLDPYNLGKEDSTNGRTTNPGIRKSPLSVEVDSEGIKGVSGSIKGVGSVSVGKEGIGGSVGGVGVTYDPKTGGGSISLPGGMKVTFKKDGCFTIETRTIWGQYAGSNIQKDPGCDSGNDDGNDDDSPKPPHCPGGTGAPRNLLPECLEGTTDLYRFAFFTSNINSGSRTYSDGKVRFDERRQIYKSISFSKDKYGTGKSVWETVRERVKYETYDGIENPRGTDFTIEEEWEATLGSLMTYSDARAIASAAIIDIKNEETVPGYVFNQSSWVQVMATDLDGNPVNCNPTGDEGCNSTNFPGTDGGRGKNNTPKTKKGGGGKPSKNKGGGSDGDDDMSQCCEETKELLLLILDHVGYNLSPIEVPSSLIDDDNSEPTIIPNIPSFLIWWFGRWDEVIGQFPQEIEIEDIDPLTKGKQKEVVKLSNVAESFVEMYAQIISVVISQQIQLDMMHRTMLTAGLNRESGIRAEEAIEAIIDYLGFDTEQKRTKIPQLFTADKDDFSDILEESESVTRTVELKGKSNLQAQLTELLHSASIIRSRYFKKVNPENAKLEVKGDLINMLTMMNRLRTVNATDQDWERFQDWLKTNNEDIKIDDENINSFNRD